MPAAFAFAAPAGPPGAPASARAGLDALHRALADFAAPAAPAFALFAPEPEAPPCAPELPAEDVEARIAQAVEDAEASLRARLETEHGAVLEAALAQALQAERDAHGAALAHALREAGEGAADAIGDRLAALRAEVESVLMGACARVLLPLAGEAVARRAAAEMAEAVREALRRESRPRITVSGPEPMLAGLRARLGEEGAGVEWREASGFDLAAAFDGSVIETRLGAWAEALRADMSEASPHEQGVGVSEASP
jgi:hypothetical protein